MQEKHGGSTSGFPVLVRGGSSLFGYGVHYGYLNWGGTENWSNGSAWEYYGLGARAVVVQGQGF